MQDINYIIITITGTGFKTGMFTSLIMGLMILLYVVVTKGML